MPNFSTPQHQSIFDSSSSFFGCLRTTLGHYQRPVSAPAGHQAEVLTDSQKVPKQVNQRAPAQQHAVPQWCTGHGQQQRYRVLQRKLLYRNDATFSPAEIDHNYGLVGVVGVISRSFLKYKNGTF